MIVTSEFLKKAGEVSCIANYTFYTSDHFWNKSGQKRKAYNRLRQHAIDIYAEYGLTNQDTLGVYAYYVKNHEKLNWSSQGVGDVEVCWKRCIAAKGLHFFSSRLVAIIPTGRKRTTVRYGEWGMELDLHCQRDFVLYNRTGWYEILAGYRYYHGFPSDQIRLSAVSGYQLFSRLRVIGGVYLDYGLNNGSKEFHGPILTLPPRYRLLKAELHAVFCAAKFISFIAGGFQHIWGENIGTGGGLFTGLWIDF